MKFAVVLIAVVLSVTFPSIKFPSITFPSISVPSITSKVSKDWKDIPDKERETKLEPKTLERFWNWFFEESDEALFLEPTIKTGELKIETEYKCFHLLALLFLGTAFLVISYILQLSLIKSETRLCDNVEERTPQTTEEKIQQELAPIWLNSPNSDSRENFEEFDFISDYPWESVFVKRAVFRRVQDETLVTFRIYDPEFQCLFDLDFHTMMSLQNSPFVEKILNCQQNETGSYVIVTEHHSGGNLSELIKSRGPMSVDEARFYAAEILEALSYIHGAGFVLENLKTKHFLLDKDGHVVLSEFENVTEIGASQEFDLSLPPEMLQKTLFGHKRNIWHLGLILYELLTGLNPFLRDTVEETHQAIFDAELPTETLCKFPTTVVDIMLRIFQKEPCNRISTDDLFSHPYFKDIDWFDVALKKLTPPYQPEPLILFNPN